MFVVKIFFFSLVLFSLFSFTTADDFTHKGGPFGAAGSWNSGVGGIPGDTGGRTDKVIVSADSVLTIGTAPTEPFNVQVDSNQFALNVNNGNYLAVAVGNSADLRIQSASSVNTLALNGDLILDSDLTVKQTGSSISSSGSISSNNDINLNTGINFDINGATINFGGAFNIGNSAKVRLAGTTIINNGDFSGSGTVEVLASSAVTLNGGSYSTSVSNSGTLTVDTNMGTSGETLTSIGSAIINFHSTTGSRSHNFGSYSLTNTVIDCDTSNNINFGSGSVDTEQLTVSGNCNVDLNLFDISHTSSVTDTTLTIQSGGTIAINGDTTIQGSSSFKSNGATFQLQSDFLVKDSADFGGQTPIFQLKNSGYLEITTSSSLNLELNQGVGSLKVNNNANNLAISGALIENQNQWYFTDCTSVSIDNTWNVKSQVDVFCPVTLGDVVTLFSAMNIQDTVTVTDTLSNTGSGGSISCTNGGHIIVQSNDDFVSSNSFSANSCQIDNSGTTDLRGSNLAWQSMIINQNNGNFDIRDTVLSLTSSSQLNWNSNSLNSNTNTQLTLTASSFDVSTSASKTFSGKLALTSGSSFESDNGFTFNGGDVSAIQSSTMVFNSDITFSNTLLSTSANSQVTQSSGDFNINSAQSLLAGTWSVSGGDFHLHNDIEITGGTFNVSPQDLYLEGDLTLTISGGTFTSTATRNRLQTGSTLDVDSATASFSGDVRIHATVTASNGGSITFLHLKEDANEDSILTANSGSYIGLGDGEYRGTANAVGGTIGVIAGTSLTCGDSNGCDIVLSSGGNLYVGDNSQFNFDNGVISGTGVIDIGNASVFNMNDPLTLGSTLSLSSSGEFHIQDDLTLNNGAVLSFTGGSSLFRLHNSGDIDIQNNASPIISITGGGFVIDKSDFEFDEGTIIELNSFNQFSHAGLEFKDDTELIINGGNSNAISDGNVIIFEDDSKFNVDQSGTALTLDTYITFKDDAIANITNNAAIVINGGTYNFQDDTAFGINGVSSLIFNDGEINFGTGSGSDHAYWQVHDSVVVVDSGRITLEKNAYAKFEAAGCDVSRDNWFSSGRIVLEKDSEVEIVQPCYFEVNWPLWYAKRGSVVTYTGSVLVQGGERNYTGPGCVRHKGNGVTENTVTFESGSNFYIIDQGCVIIESSTVAITDSNFLVRDLGSLELDASSLAVTGTSTFKTLNNGEFWMHSGSAFLLESPVILDNEYNSTRNNNYHFKIESSSFTVKDDVQIQGDTLAILNDTSTLTLQGTGKISLFGNSTLEVEESTLTVGSDLVLRSNLEVRDGVVDISGTFKGESTGSALFTNSILTTSGSISLLQTSSLLVEQNTNITIQSTGDFILNGNAESTIDNSLLDVLGEVILDTTKSFNVINNGEARIAGSLMASSDSNILISDASMRFQGSSEVTLEDSAIYTIDMGGSLDFISGTLLLRNSSTFDVKNQSTFTVSSGGNIVSSGDADIIFNFSTLSLGSGSSIDLSELATLQLLNNSNGTVLGDVTLNDSVEITVESSTMDLSGQLDLFGSSKYIILDYGTTNLIGGDVTLEEGSSLSITDNSDFNLNGSGKLTMFEDSSFIVDNSLLFINAQEFTMEGNSTGLLTGDGELRVNGGILNILEESIVTIDDGKLEVLGNNVNINATAKLLLTTSDSFVHLDGGNINIDTEAKILSESASITIDQGDLIATGFSEISLDIQSTFSISSSSASSIFSENAHIDILSDSIFTSQGTAMFKEDSTWNVNSADFIVEGNNAIFSDNSEGIVRATGLFILNDGDVVFEDNASVNITGLSGFFVNGGTLTQYNSSDIIVTQDSDLLVLGSVSQYNSALIQVDTNSNLTISGSGASITSDGSSIVNVLSSSFAEIKNNAGVNLLDNAIWNINSGTISLVGGTGSFIQEGTSKTILDNSDFDIDGFVNLKQSSSITSNSTTLTFSNGDIIVEEASFIEVFENGILNVENGLLDFSGTSNFTIDGTSELHVMDGSVIFRESSNLFTDIGTILDVAGTFSLEDNVCTTFTEVEFTVTGEVYLRNQTCLNIIDSPIVINDGLLASYNDHQLSVESSTFELNIGSVLFSGSSSSFVDFSDVTVDLIEGTFSVTEDLPFTSIDSSISILNGEVIFSDQSQSNWFSSTLSVQIFSGEPALLSFTENTVNYFEDSTLETLGGSVSLRGDSQNSADNLTITVQSGVLGMNNTATISVIDSLFEVNFGSILIVDNTSMLLTQSEINMTAVGGDFTALDFACVTLISSLVSVSGGSIDFNENTCMHATDTPIEVYSGSVVFSHNSLLNLTTPLSTLTVNDGNFELRDTANFLTVPYTQIIINGGNFNVYDGVNLDFNLVDMFVGGNVRFSEDSTLDMVDSNLNIVEGTFRMQNDTSIHVESSNVTVTNGTLSTANNVNFEILSGSNILVEGNVIFSGSVLSNHDITNSNLTIRSGGDLVIQQHAHLELDNAFGSILDGSLEMFENSQLTVFNSIVSLDGDGTLHIHDESAVTVTDDSTLSVNSNGATAIFEGDSSLDVHLASNFALTDGSVRFEDTASINMWEGTRFDVLGGSFVMANNSTLVAYPFTQGTIVGGDFYVYDNASVTFIQSNIKIVGALNSNSSIPVQFIANSTIIIDGAPVVIYGDATIYVTNSTFLHVIDGSIVLRDYATLLSEGGSILVSGGSIIGLDYSSILATDGSDFVVTGGNVTTDDSSYLLVDTQSILTVTANGTSSGSVYVLGESTMEVINQSQLLVIEGNLEIANHTHFHTSNGTLIRVIDGDIAISDYVSFDALLHATLEVLDGGSFYAGGYSTILNFDESDTRIVGGDFVLSIRSSMFASDSTFEISGNGNVLLTDMTRTHFNDGTTLEISGGGNLELVRSANLFLSSSSVSVDDAGSILANADASIEMIQNGVLQVTNGGSIEFYDESLLIGLGGSIAQVTGGGDILFDDLSSAIIQNQSSFSVSGSGNIIFQGQSSADISSQSEFFVEDGGNIQFSGSSSLSSDSSSLTVRGGGSIIFTGDGVSNVENSSTLSVNGGNIEYHDEREVNFDSSSLSITSGNLETYDSTVFNMENQSSGSVSGGNFILSGSSIINMIELSSLDISGGNVELYGNGEVNMNTGSITVSGDGSSSGHFSANNFVSSELLSSSITVAGGNFVANDNASFDLSLSSITVSSGSLSSNDNTIFAVSQSTINVSGGSLTLTDSAIWNVISQSTTSVSGGDVLLIGSSNININDSILSVSSGNLNLDDNTFVDIESGSVVVSGGNVLFLGSSVFDGLITDITVTCGQMIYDDNSQFDIDQSHVIVDRSSCGVSISERLDTPITVEDLIVVGGHASFTSSDSIFDLVDGNFLFVEFATSNIDSSTVNIIGGNMEYIGSTIHTLTQSDINISIGSFHIGESVDISILDQSSIDITGGDLIIDGIPNVLIENSSSNISSGIASFLGGDIDILSSELNVVESGSIIFGGSTLVNVEQSLLSLSGDGIFEIGDNTQMSITSSSLSISGGLFTINENAIVDILSSTYEITGGDTNFEGFSQISIEDSSFSVLDGNVFFSGNSQVLINNSDYDVLGGNVVTSGNSLLQLNDGSCFTINDGSVEYTENNHVELTNSCWNVLGGNVNFSDNSQYTLGSESTLTIKDGSFITEGQVNILIDNSQTFINGGDMKLFGESTIELRNSGLIEITSGNALFSGSITSIITDSEFNVNGGYVEFDGSSNVSWTNSKLTVSLGDMVTKGDSIVDFIDSTVLVSGGGLRFMGTSNINIETSSFTINQGSTNFLENTIVSFSDSSIDIIEGDLQFGDESSVVFTDSPIYLSGQLEFIGNANTKFTNSDIDIESGSFHAKDHSNVFFEKSTLDISGSLYAQNFADVRFEDSRVTIENGDFIVNDLGSFNMHRSSLDITSGNFIVSNPTKAERKYISFTNSVINVENNGNVLNGHMELNDNVEMSLLSSDVVIDGDLILTGKASLNVFEESSFHIPNGIVSMEETSSIIIDGASSLLNQGQLVAPGSLRVPSDSSASNEGILESSHDFNSNCFADLSNGAPLSNSGTFNMAPSSSSDYTSPLQSCVDNMQHSGLMQLAGTNMTFNIFQSTSSSTITLSGASIGISTGNPFQSDGSLGGSGSFTGSFINNPDAIVMANGEEGTTTLDVQDDFTSSGTIFFSINSRDLSDPDAITQISAGNQIGLEGGRACVCFNPDLVLEDGDRFDLMTAQSQLSGRFDQVQFDCSECPTRNAKSIAKQAKAAEADDECEPTADYGAISFSVLFESCDGGSGNYLDSISPPWYVIFPVAIGIILFVVIFFGGALLIDARIRKKKFQRKVAKKRRARVSRMTAGAGSSSSGSRTL